MTIAPMLNEDVPQLSVPIVESIIRHGDLTAKERNYVINRVVGEYAAYALEEYRNAIEVGHLDEDGVESGLSWREIEDRARGRHEDVSVVLRDVIARNGDYDHNIEWSWITIDVMRSLGEAGRLSDDSLLATFGGAVESPATRGLPWRQPVNGVSLREMAARMRTTFTDAEVDEYLSKEIKQIRSRYVDAIDQNTPYLNTYAARACQIEQARMMSLGSWVGERQNPKYQVSPTVALSAQATIIARHVRPSPYDIIEALQDGDFKKLSKSVVMPESEFDELMSDAMDIYMDGHGRNDETLEEVTTFMDTAERELERPIVWRDAPARDLLREEQSLRDVGVATTSDVTVEPTAVEYDENGMPSLTQTETPEAPSFMDEVRAGYEEAELEHEVAQMEESGSISDDAAEEIEETIESGDHEAGRRALEEAREEEERKRAEAVREAEAFHAGRSQESNTSPSHDEGPDL